MSPAIPIALSGLAAALAVALAIALRRARRLRRMLFVAIRAARTDRLTGLANHAGLQHRLTHLRTNMQNGEHVAAIALDLDGLTVINDLDGHQIGDDIVTEVARRITTRRARTTCAARIDGGRFVVLLDPYPDGDRANRYAHWLAHTLAQDIAQTRLPDYPAIGVTATVGVAVVPANDIDGLLAAAHADLNYAKSASRGQHTAREAPIPLPRHRRRDTRTPGPAHPPAASERSTGYDTHDLLRRRRTLPPAQLHPAGHRPRLVS